MSISKQTAVKESKMNITATNLIRWTGLSAMVAGICYVIVGIFHPLNILSSVLTSRWVIVHIFACAMSFFGLFGMVGLYVRQVEKSGWLGLVGFVLFSLWLALIGGFTFVEVFILPPLARETPYLVQGFLGMFSGSASVISFGVLPTVWTVTNLLYLLGGLLFGIATFRAGILPRWAGILLAVGTIIGPVAILFPPELQPIVAVPVGLAIAWLGYALFAERREKTS